MKRAHLAWLLASACRVDFPAVEDARIACSEEAPTCPGTLQCAVAIKQCVEGEPDTTAPRLVGVSVVDERTLDVLFDEAMGEGSEAPQHFAITRVIGGEALAVVASARTAPDTVRLVTGEQAGGARYALSVMAVTDAGGNTLAGDARAEFTGGGTPADPTPPSPLTPAAGARSLGLQARLAWTPKAKARSYEVTVATDAAYTAHISGSPFTVTDTTTLDVTLDRAVRHYWRIRADVTSAGEYGESTFDAMDDAVYVYCASGVCAPGAAGNITSPVASVREALNLASALGAKAVRVAGSAQPYREGALIVADGVDLLGGYAADFSGRDVAAHETTLAGVSATFVQAIGLLLPTRIDGLTLLGANAVGSDATVTVLAIDVGEALTLHSLTVRAGSAEEGASYGIRVAGTAAGDPGPRIEACDVSAGAGARSVAVVIDRVNAVVTGSTLHGGNVTNGESTGLELTDSGAEIYANALIAGGDGGSSTGLVLDGAVATSGRAEAHIYDNLLISAGAPGGGRDASVGVRSYAGRALFENNVIRAAGASVDALSLSADLSVGLSAAEDASTVRGGSITSGDVDFGGGFSNPNASSVGVVLEGSATLVDGVAVRAGRATLTSGNGTPRSLAVDARSGALSGAVVANCVLAPSATSGGFGESMGVRGVGWSDGTVQGNTLVLPTGASTVIGVEVSTAYNLEIDGNTMTLPSAAVSVAGISWRSARGRLSANRIDGVPSTVTTNGIYVRFESYMSDGIIVVANNVVLSPDSSADSNALRFDAGGQPVTHVTPLIISNNTLVAGAAAGTGRAVFLENQGTGGSPTTLPPVTMTNNVLTTRAGAGGRFCIHGWRAIQTARASPSSLLNNAFIDCPTALVVEPADPVDPMRTCASDATANCYLTVSDVHNAAQSADPRRLLHASNNVEVAAPFFDASFALTAESPTGLTLGGLDTSQSVCEGGTGFCGHVLTDIDGEARSCTGPGDCYSLGAFEL